MHRSADKQIRVLALLLIALVALLVRVHHLDAESLFMDEIHQVFYYTGDLFQAMQGSLRQQQPPLDYIVGFLLYQLNGSDFMLRLPAALFGTGAVVLIALLASRGVSAQRGDDALRLPVVIVVGLVAAILPYSVYISQDLRPYSSAIFFFLLLILVYDRLFEKSNPGVRDYVALGLVTLALLLSRTLSPLAICLVLGLTLFLPWLFHLRSGSRLQSVRLKAQVAMALALVVYLPVLFLIVAGGQRYLDSDSVVAEWPLDAISDAWTAQLEPFGLAHVWLPLAGVWASWRADASWFRLPRLIVIVLVGATAVHFLVFHSMTPHPFRPPYSIYLYPSALILSASGAYYLCNLLGERLSPNTARITLALVAAVVLLHTFSAMLDFKQRRIKTDWRSFAAYVNGTDADARVWFSHTPASAPVWDPGLYGFMRYPVKGIVSGNLADLIAQPEIGGVLEGMQRKPVLVFFEYRDYLLTSRSRVPLMPKPEGAQGVSELEAPPAVERVDFGGLSVFSLRESRDDTRQELLQLMEEMLEANPDAPYLETFRAAYRALNGRREAR